MRQFNYIGIAYHGYPPPVEETRGPEFYMDNYTTLWNNKQRLAAGRDSGYGRQMENPEIGCRHVASLIMPHRSKHRAKYCYMKLLRKTDILLIVILAVIPVCMLAFNMISAMNHTETRLVILKDGDVYGTYLLTEDRTIKIGKTNICEIRGGEVKMTHADCPDQICVHSVPISRYGGTIVCLPNKIILSIEGAEDNKDTDVPDAIAR
jgi:hypothetical protein